MLDIATFTWDAEMAQLFATPDAEPAAEAAAEADSIADIADSVEAIRSMVNRLLQRVTALEMVKAAPAEPTTTTAAPAEPTTATDYLALIAARSNSSAPAVRQNLGGRADRPAAEAFRPLVDRYAGAGKVAHTNVSLLKRLASPCSAEHAPANSATWYSAIMYASSDGARSRLTAMMLATPKEECQ